jgi:hypothetical protein
MGVRHLVRHREVARQLIAFIQTSCAASQLVLGWFIIPAPFSKDHARLHPRGDQTPSPGFFPAVFVFNRHFPAADVPMACLHILLHHGPVWVVHRDRMVAVKEL